MKLIGIFLAVCGLILGAVIWHISASVSESQPQEAQRLVRDAAPTAAPDAAAPQSPPSERDTRSAPSTIAAEVAPPAAETQPSTSAVELAEPAPASAPAVRWADEQTERMALRQLADARQRLAQDPSHIAALEDELAALRALERWSDAAETLARLVELEPDNTQRRLEYADTLIRLERWMAVIETLKVAVAQAPDDVHAWYCLAAARQVMGHLQDAERCWGRVIELAADNLSAFKHRGEVRLLLHDWTAAAADFEAALRLDAGDVDAALNLAVAWSRLGRFADAEKCAADVLTRHPRHVRAVNCLAEMAWRAYRADPSAAQTHRDATIRWCRQSLEIDPAQAAMQALLSAALAER